jgi:hypothetical protein
MNGSPVKKSGPRVEGVLQYWFRTSCGTVGAISKASEFPGFEKPLRRIGGISAKRLKTNLITRVRDREFRARTGRMGDPCRAGEGEGCVFSLVMYFYLIML